MNSAAPANAVPGVGSAGSSTSADRVADASTLSFAVSFQQSASMSMSSTASSTTVVSSDCLTSLPTTDGPNQFPDPWVGGELDGHAREGE
ncbi:hypothetical protein VTO42DRAFT_6618 [Malbranchea cinnamomea]